MKVRKGWKAGVLSTVVTLAATAPAGGQQPAREPSAVETLLAQEVAGSGVWRRDNPDWSPGAEVPSHWIRVSRWGPAHSVVTSDALSVFPDGRCEALSHIVFHLDRKSGGVRLTAFAAPGIVAEGTVSARDRGGRLVELSVPLPDGTTRRSRDLTDQRGDTLVTVTEAWQDGAWVRRDEVRWVRQPAPPRCADGSPTS